MELRETVLFSRARVCASGKAVPLGGGGSKGAAVGAGRCIVGSAGGLDDCEVFAAAVSTATSVAEETVVVGFLPSRKDAFLSMGVLLPALGGPS